MIHLKGRRKKKKRRKICKKEEDRSLPLFFLFSFLVNAISVFIQTKIDFFLSQNENICEMNSIEFDKQTDDTWKFLFSINAKKKNNNNNSKAERERS